MNRYLGTKTKILPDINKVLVGLQVNAGRVCDVFSGSLAVSLFLKRSGYSVIANDINPLSYAYSQAFLIPNDVPQFDISRLLKEAHPTEIRNAKELAKTLLENQRVLFEKENRHGEFSSWVDYTKRLSSLALVSAFLEGAFKSALQKCRVRSCITDHYTKVGTKSHYKSMRGRRGRRNYFSEKNGRRMDFILSHIRHWWKEGLLSEQGKCVLISILLDGMERCVNINGTYHDFPRQTLEERARRPYRTCFPNYFGLLYAKQKHWAGCKDSLEFIREAPAHDVLYIDPPYNFRQYTAYYHLPNFITRYADIGNLEAYLKNIQFVRGQNMADDFASPFSNKEQFLSSLRQLIVDAKCRFVVMSYFDGANHWNRFLEEDNSLGYHLLGRFFRDENLFERGSFKVVPVQRNNYQSQNGHATKKVTEYLFVGRKTLRKPKFVKEISHVAA
ncbi:MAG: DNA adenine methylase [Candidatus Omnitrophota bacterium]|nr:DNA adenine methylase [Candidatus Omnitrophota bacterium]